MAGKSADKKVNDEVQVTHEDQKMINSFANKNNKHNELKAAVARKKKELENLEDAGNELLLLDDTESVPLQTGEVFIRMSSEEVQAYLDSRKDELQGEIRTLDTEATELKNTLVHLKTKLYAKFGNSINLEEEDDS